MKKEILWNDENWTLDYSTNTIYQETALYEDDPTMLTMQARIGDYPFREVKGIVYFKANNEYYKVKEKEAIRISKDEYKEIENYRKINVNDKNDVKFIASYINSIIIDELFRQKYNIKIYTKVEKSVMVPIITHRYSSIIKERTQNMARGAMINLPRYIDKRTIKKTLKEKLVDNKDYVNEIIDQIYENQKHFLNQIAADIKVQISAREQNTKEEPKSK